MLLPRELIRAVPWPTELQFGWSPLQSGLGGSPWHVAVASICLCRVKRNADVIESMFDCWPTPMSMEASDTALEVLLAPLGLQRQRARSIQQLSRKWYLDTWEDLRELKGVGTYVADAVSLFCFGNAGMTCNDSVLREYARNYVGPSITNIGANWYVNGQCFWYPERAYSYYMGLRKASA